MKFGKYLIIGIVLDVIDWIGLGLIPFLMDIVDVGFAYFWYRKVGVAGALAAVEVVPGADLLPTNIALGYYADQKGGYA